MSDEGLLADLDEAADANMHHRTCQVCRALLNMSDEGRGGVERALAGTIGERRLDLDVALNRRVRLSLAKS